MGIQFSVFEQTKNALAVYRGGGRAMGGDLNAAEVVAAASVGGLVAASVMYPVQHLLPVQHWALTAPTSPAGIAAAASAAAASAAAAAATAARRGTPPNAARFLGGISAAMCIPKPTLFACLARFMPATVVTAVTYEYAARFVRDRDANHVEQATPSSLLYPSAVSSSSSTVAPAAVAPSSSSSFSDLIASRASYLLHDVDAEIHPHLQPPAHLPSAAAAAGPHPDASASSASVSIASHGHHSHSHALIRAPAQPTLGLDRPHVQPLDHATPLMHTSGLDVRQQHADAAMAATAEGAAPQAAAAAAGHSHPLLGLSRSTSHPVLSSARRTTLAAGQAACKPSAALEPW